MTRDLSSTDARLVSTLPLPVLPEPGDFGLVATYGGFRDRTLNRIVRWATDAPVNHAFIYMGDGDIVEAAPGGARRVKLDTLDADLDSIVWSTGRLQLDLLERWAITSWAQAFADRAVGYGYADILAIGLAQPRLGGRIDPTALLEHQPWWVKRIQSWDTLICSQLVDLCWRQADRHLFTDARVPGLVSPGDLWRRLGSPTVLGALPTTS